MTIISIIILILIPFGFYGIYKFIQLRKGEDAFQAQKAEVDFYLAQKKLEAKNAVDKANEEVAQREKQLKELEKEVEALTTKSDICAAYDMDISEFEGLTSEECKNKLLILKQEEKSLVENDKAVYYENLGLGNKFLNNNIKQILRTFNVECDKHLMNISFKNIEAVKSKIQRSFEILNRIYSTDGVELSKELLLLKLKEASAVFECESKKEQERLQQQAIREQMVEEEKVRREIEREKQKIIKDETQFRNELNRLMKYMQKSNDETKTQIYIEQIEELKQKIKDLEERKQTVLDREQNARAGFVYIISNIGSFGENIYKIGMTRRLEPMDRVKELSSASVPFEFDVHAMIFSEDAPQLESDLHSKFNENRINKINPRKEFFKVQLEDIVDEVKKHNATVQFTMVAAAKEYRESLMEEQSTEEGAQI